MTLEARHIETFTLRVVADLALGTGLPVWCQGAALPGIYPPNAENKVRYDAQRRR